MLRHLAIAACIVGGATLTSRAADMPSPVAPMPETAERDGWTFTVAPYFWMAGLDGRMAQFGSPVVDIHQSFSDILHDFDFGLMAISEARKGRFTIFNDLQYSRVSSEATTPFGVLASTVQVKSETFSGLLGTSYSVIEDDAGRLEVAVGARLWSVDTRLSFSGGPLDGVSFSDGDTWIDGLVGLRGNVNLTPNLYLTGWGLVGAGEADLDWDVAASFGYRVNDSISALLGYRALGVDYSNDGFVFDVIQHGPVLGMVVRF